MISFCPASPWSHFTLSWLFVVVVFVVVVFYLKLLLLLFQQAHISAAAKPVLLCLPSRSWRVHRLSLLLFLFLLFDVALLSLVTKFHPMDFFVVTCREFYLGLVTVSLCLKVVFLNPSSLEIIPYS